MNTKAVEAALFDSLEGQQWEAAAEHRLGSGLQQGASLQPAMTVRATLAPARAHTLDKIVAGGLWFRQRLFEAGRLTTGVCRWCEKEPETEHHVFWECPAAGKEPTEQETASEHLRHQAGEQKEVAAAWWCMGPPAKGGCNATGAGGKAEHCQLEAAGPSTKGHRSVVYRWQRRALG